MSTTTTDSLVRAVALIVALLVLVPLVMMLFAFPFMGFGHMGWAADGGMGVWGWLMPLLALLVLGVGGYLLYGVLSGSVTDPALEELRSAYARGEIDDEEFETRRERLRSE
ncbi:MAG: SHOCT domain-containing protein [Halalkalicoccus sp.]